MAKFCNKCGNELRPNVKFCTKCGNQIVRKEEMQAQEDEKSMAVKLNVSALRSSVQNESRITPFDMLQKMDIQRS